MLINTQQIVNITDMRGMLGNIVERAEHGEMYLISKKGSIKAALVPLSFVEKKYEKENVMDRIVSVRSGIDNDLKTTKNTVRDSTDVIREQREARSRMLTE